jgi:hypothetical protein
MPLTFTSVQSVLLPCIAGLLFIAGSLLSFSPSAFMAAARSCTAQRLCKLGMLHSLTVRLSTPDQSIVRLLLLHWLVVEAGGLVLLINTTSATYFGDALYVETG